MSLRMRRSSGTSPPWSGLTTAQCPCAPSAGGEKWCAKCSKNKVFIQYEAFKVQVLIEINGFLKIIGVLWCSFSKIKEENDANFQQGFWRFYLWGLRLAPVRQAVSRDRNSQKGMQIFCAKKFKSKCNVAIVSTILWLFSERFEWPASVFPTVCTMRSFPWEFSC